MSEGLPDEVTDGELMAADDVLFAEEVLRTRVARDELLASDENALRDGAAPGEDLEDEVAEGESVVVTAMLLGDVLAEGDQIVEESATVGEAGWNQSGTRGGITARSMLYNPTIHLTGRSRPAVMPFFNQHIPLNPSSVLDS